MSYTLLHPDDTICALSTPPGTGALAMIRISGKQAFEIVEHIFSKKLHDKRSHTAHYGQVRDGHRTVDEVVINIFKGPHSFTGENTVEIACHGSAYIKQEIIRLLINHGCRMATAGEYTLRAFVNGKMDLSEAEAVADLISANSAAAHQLAMHQLKGGFSRQIGLLREKLIDFASLIELELDFAEEDVEFADRSALKELLDETLALVSHLMESFSLGNVIRNGVPVAIIGAPNAGKSTLLNALLDEERAIVSEIPGTTRDSIEDELQIEGVAFRFIDTAGIRNSDDVIENMGIDKTFEKARQAQIILYLADLSDPSWKEKAVHGIRELQEKGIGEKKLIVVANKADLNPAFDDTELYDFEENLVISAGKRAGLDELKKKLVGYINLGQLNSGETVVTNSRHYEALKLAYAHLENVRSGLNTRITGDFLAMDIRQALHHLGSITGQISTEDLLGSIFGRFCIGK
jgi:tRNA modification GTPase